MMTGVIEGFGDDVSVNFEACLNDDVTLFNQFEDAVKKLESKKDK